jgi:hypothetical protein
MAGNLRSSGEKIVRGYDEAYRHPGIQMLKDLNCFVIMPFGVPFDRYYLNIFAPAIQEAGLRAYRADSIFSSTTIMSDVWNCIRKASVVLADVTGKNANVFYELGLAHASRKPVLIITATLEDVPFDLKGLRVIEYDKDDENWGSVLKVKITANLKAALSDPAIAVPSTFLENAIEPSFISDPLSLQLKQITDALRLLRSTSTTKEPPTDEARRFMDLLKRHSNLLQGASELARLQIFENLVDGDISAAIERIQHTLNISRIEAQEIGINIFDWMKLYAANPK